MRLPSQFAITALRQTFWTMLKSYIDFGKAQTHSAKLIESWIAELSAGLGRVLSSFRAAR
jgi:hypothetical protein